MDVASFTRELETLKTDDFFNRHSRPTTREVCCSVTIGYSNHLFGKPHCMRILVSTLLPPSCWSLLLLLSLVFSLGIHDEASDSVMARDRPRRISKGFSLEGIHARTAPLSSSETPPMYRRERFHARVKQRDYCDSTK